MAIKGIIKIVNTGFLTDRMIYPSTKRKILKLLIGLFVLTGCAPAQPANSSSQLDLACAIVNNWPEDYVTIWPLAIKRHNESPDTVSAGDYMNEYLDLASSLYTIDDTEALGIIANYKNYWQLLEVDLIRGEGVLSKDPISSGIVGSLMQTCDDLGRGFND